MIERKFLVIAGFLVMASWMTGDVQAKKTGGPPGLQAAPVHSWDQILPADDGDPTTGCNSIRFTCVMATTTNPDGEGVRDNETGLVWEQSPNTTQRPWEFVSGDPINARSFCANSATGGRKGWRLPSFYELASLVDPLNPTGNPDLPPGHPFSNVQSDFYWSATRNARVPDQPFTLRFLDGSVASAFLKTTNFVVWCVRGGSPGPDVY